MGEESTHDGQDYSLRCHRPARSYKLHGCGGIGRRGALNMRRQKGMGFGPPTRTTLTENLSPLLLDGGNDDYPSLNPRLWDKIRVDDDPRTRCLAPTK